MNSFDVFLRRIEEVTGEQMVVDNRVRLKRAFEASPSAAFEALQRFAKRARDPQRAPLESPIGWLLCAIQRANEQKTNRGRERSVAA